MRRWTAGTKGANLQRDAGGSRTHTKPLCRRPPSRLAPTSNPVRFNSKCPRQDSDLVFDLRRVACDPPHSEDDRRILGDQYPAEDSNLVRQLRRLLCVPAHSQGIFIKLASKEDEAPDGSRRRLAGSPRALMSRPGFESGPGPSEGPNAFRYTIETHHTDTHQNEQSRRLGSHQHHPAYKTGALLNRATSALTRSTQHEREESNPVRRFWRPPALPGARSYRFC
jgi:hypothetical protein